jgi:alkylation response protein AidB-like acyl-CoA dehydrogenase|tara:strand:+ start:227 stop:2044 length:1818 start_codon:yes stop_codon:yes gene_type:complete
MPSYHASLNDINFALTYIADYSKIAALPANSEATGDVVEAVLTEAAKFAATLLAPLNQSGDQQGCRLGNGEVQTPDGFREVYRQYIDAGWAGLPFPQQHGGQGLPWILGAIVQEMWDGANMAWGLCPILSRGAIELLLSHGSDAQKDLYLPRLISGEWSGTMNLTEPAAGTDLAMIKTVAVAEDDHFLIRGQKIFITWGEQDFTENILHLVLARTPDAPPGARGISLFMVPKHLVNDDGSLGARNDVQCVALEKKLGVRGSATCAMSYGDNAGAVGYLIGEEGKGIATMFTMMNNERLAVALQSIAVADRAYQLARDYAKDRVQSRSLTDPGNVDSVTIIHHADVRRMLLSMKARIEAGRALCYYAMSQIDISHAEEDSDRREAAQKRVDLLTPVIKGWCTESVTDITSMGIQIHGGMGFIEETGAAQYLRDGRICAIYEGTSGIQSNDLVLRKILADGGEQMRLLLEEMQGGIDEWRQSAAENDELMPIILELQQSLDVLSEATDWILMSGAKEANSAAASAFHYLMLCGYVTSNWLLVRGIVGALGDTSLDDSESAAFSEEYLTVRIQVARFSCEQFLSMAAGLLKTIQKGDEAIMAIPEDEF